MWEKPTSPAGQGGGSAENCRSIKKFTWCMKRSSGRVWIMGGNPLQAMIFVGVIFAGKPDMTGLPAGMG